MAYEDTPNQSWFRRNAKTIIWVAVLLALAGVFRIAFNYEPAINGGQYRYAGNDDYYHHRVVEYIQTTGHHLLRDPLLNYPVGTTNPRPPLYNWHVAMEGRVLEAFGMEADQAASYALEWGSAFWGVLTVIPIWLTGRFLYSNRAGLWAGFLVAASPAHIQRSGFGLGDHDAFVIFWLALGFYFLVRALRGTRDDTRVESWRSLRSIADGFGTYIDHHREGLAYAFLAGMCLVAIALAWEGYPYAIAIYAVYYVLQLLTNQIRRRDSTGDVLVMLIVLGLLTLLPLPYYWTVGVTVTKTISASTYVLAILVLLTLALVPTRDLPSILVLPGLALLAVLGWLVLTFLLPDVGAQLLSANGYFNQSKVYSTIAEAQRTELGSFVFSIGFMTFFLALVGFVYATVRFFKRRERDQLFVVGWGLLSIYMAFAAARFVFNAAPVFAILAGWMVDKIVGWMNFRERVRDFQSLRHESWGRALRSTLGAKQVAGSLFLGLVLIVPNVWFSFDAGLPTETRADYRKDSPGNDFLTNQTGAFGQSFLDDDWLDVYGWLARQDTSINPPEKRPAHVAWWDYGFWEADISRHPTLADNFQNGIIPAGRVLASESEKEGIDWLTVRILEGDWRNHGGRYGDALVAALRDHNASLPDLLPSDMSAADDLFAAHRVLTNQTPDEDAAAEFYMKVSGATGYFFGYFLTDLRMLPIDDPNTPRNIESGSIFYAPIYLANKNPDDFVQTVYVGAGGGEYRVNGYEVDAQGNSHQVSPPKIIGPDGKQYLVGANSIIRTVDGRRIDYTDHQGRGVQIEQIKLDFKPAFFRTLFYRGFVGGDGTAPTTGSSLPIEFYCNFPNAGKDLRHWRLVRGGPMTPAGTPDECQKALLPEGDANRTHKWDADSIKAPTVRLLQFYLGAEYEGRLDSSGQALAGVTVEVYDDLGVRHDTATTDADGRYKVFLPPGLTDEATGQLGQTTVRFSRGGIEVANKTVTVTLDQAMRRAPLTETGDVSLQPGNLDVFAFLDRDRNGAYDATIDAPASGANITYDQKTAQTGSDGRASFTNVAPGGSDLAGSLRGYEVQSVRGTVPSGGTGNANVAFTARTVTVNGTVTGPSGVSVSGLQVSIKGLDAPVTPDGPVQTTDANGTFSAPLYPTGRYNFIVNATVNENGTDVTYSGEKTVELRVNEPVPTVEIALTRKT
jgi:dolichyl-phosphooligosaccharide-protein glycotransferase